jgi:hypothetical protein
LVNTFSAFAIALLNRSLLCFALEKAKPKPKSISSGDYEQMLQVNWSIEIDKSVYFNFIAAKLVTLEAVM